MDDRKASLGCGTLILIALIVLFVGNAGSQDVLEEVQALRVETQELSHSMTRMRAELDQVRQLLEAR